MRANTIARIILSLALVLFLIGSMTLTSFPANNKVMNPPDKEWVDGTYMRSSNKRQSAHSVGVSGAGDGTSSYPPEDMEITVGDFATDRKSVV